MSQDLLIFQLRFLRENVNKYLSMFPEEHSHWSPSDKLRTVFSLASHLAGLPQVAVVILQEQPTEEVYALEEPVQEAKPAKLSAYFSKSMDELIAVMTCLSDNEFRTSMLKSPFSPDITPQALVLDTITHIYHHRGQLHNYYKQLGLNVSTDTLYAL